jgi:hypothetical protein
MTTAFNLSDRVIFPPIRKRAIALKEKNRMQFIINETKFYYILLSSRVAGGAVGLDSGQRPWEEAHSTGVSRYKFHSFVLLIIDCMFA